MSTGTGPIVDAKFTSKQKDFETPESTICILLHAIATRICTSLSQLDNSVPILLHSAFALSLRVSFTCSVNSALLTLLSTLFCSPPYSPNSFSQVSVQAHLLPDLPWMPSKAAGSWQGHFLAQEWRETFSAISPLQHHLQSLFHLNCHHSDLKGNETKGRRSLKDNIKLQL